MVASQQPQQPPSSAPTKDTDSSGPPKTREELSKIVFIGRAKTTTATTTTTNLQSLALIADAASKLRVADVAAVPKTIETSVAAPVSTKPAAPDVPAATAVSTKHSKKGTSQPIAAPDVPAATAVSTKHGKKAISQPIAASVAAATAVSTKHGKKPSQPTRTMNVPRPPAGMPPYGYMGPPFPPFYTAYPYQGFYPPTQPGPPRHLSPMYRAQQMKPSLLSEMKPNASKTCKRPPTDSKSNKAKGPQTKQPRRYQQRPINEQPSVADLIQGAITAAPIQSVSVAAPAVPAKAKATTDTAKAAAVPADAIEAPLHVIQCTGIPSTSLQSRGAELPPSHPDWLKMVSKFNLIRGRWYDMNCNAGTFETKNSSAKSCTNCQKARQRVRQRYFPSLFAEEHMPPPPPPPPIPSQPWQLVSPGLVAEGIRNCYNLCGSAEEFRKSIFAKEYVFLIKAMRLKNIDFAIDPENTAELCFCAACDDPLIFELTKKKKKLKRKRRSDSDGKVLCDECNQEATLKARRDRRGKEKENANQSLGIAL
jgi:hypothetical protein